MQRLTLLLLAVIVVACGDRTAAPAPATAPVPAAPTVAIQVPITLPKSGTVAESPPESRLVPVAKLALDGEGLRVFTIVTGASRLIAFKTAQSDVLRMLNAVLAAPPAAQGENLDCRASYASWSNGLTIWFMRERFVGWSMQAASDGLATASGVQIGSSREALESAYTVKVGPSTLGIEFSAGALSGLLDSASAEARVTHLWAGITCLAR